MSTSLSGIPHPFKCKVDGREWSLFSADFKTDDGKYSFFFYAISYEHALHILDDIKETATLSGESIVAYKA